MILVYMVCSNYVSCIDMRNFIYGIFTRNIIREIKIPYGKTTFS